MAEPHRRRVDELLWPVLPVSYESSPTARQCLPEALGWEKVSAAAGLQTGQAGVGRADRKTARPVRPLEVGPRELLTDRRMRRAPGREAFTPGAVGGGGRDAPGHPTAE